MDIQAGIMKRADRKRIGKKMRVLVDAVEDGIAVARGENDAPDIDNVIQFNATKRIKPGDFVEVNIIKAFRGGLWAEKARKTSK